MSKYKINVIAHQLKGKKVAKFGEVVDEKQLTGSAKDLIKDGFIVKLPSKEAKALQEAADKKEADIKTAKEAVTKASVNQLKAK